MFEEILRFFRVRLEWSFRQRAFVIFLGPKFRSLQYLKVFIRKCLLESVGATEKLTHSYSSQSMH